MEHILYLAQELPCAVGVAIKWKRTIFKDAKSNSFHSFWLKMSVPAYSIPKNFEWLTFHMGEVKYMHPIYYISKLKEKKIKKVVRLMREEQESGMSSFNFG